MVSVNLAISAKGTFSFVPSCFVRSSTSSRTSFLVSSISPACFTYTLYSASTDSRVVALELSASLSIICWNTCATVIPCSIALSRSTMIRSSPVDSSRPSETFSVPSTPSTIAAICPAISCSLSMSRPRTCTVMPLPPKALISMEDVSMSISASFSSQISAMSAIISSAISSLSFSLSAFNVT